MPQPNVINLHMIVDTSAARKCIKRVMAESAQANRELARLESRLLELETRLAETYGIHVEVQND